jgi:hypothetical protein
MPFLDDNDKPPLLDERQSVRNAEAGWGCVLLVTYPIAAHIFYIPSVVRGVMIAVLKRQRERDRSRIG